MLHEIYYYRARYYDPSVGRFLSEDPIGYAGGDYNLYRYVENNPAKYTDPSGRNPLLWGVLGAITLTADDHTTLFREEGPIKPIKYDVPELDKAADPQRYEDIIERKEIDNYLKKYEKKKRLNPGSCQMG